jgi:hypothetical protein
MTLRSNNTPTSAFTPTKEASIVTPLRGITAPIAIAFSGKRRRNRRAALAAVAVAAVAAGAFLATPAPARAATTSPWWHLTAALAPTTLQPGTEGQIVLTAYNAGDAPADAAASPVTVTDRLPSGVEALSGEVRGMAASIAQLHPGPVECETSGQLVTCTFEGPKPLLPFVPLEVFIKVKVGLGASSGQGEVAIAGGGAPAVSHAQQITVGTAETPFGLEGFEVTPEDEDGSPDIQAGSHPFQLTTGIALNEKLVEPEGGISGKGILPSPVDLPKDFQVRLPPGLVGNVTSLPQCTEAEFTHEVGFENLCPPDSAIGVAEVDILEPTIVPFYEPPDSFGTGTATVPVFNLVPATGEPARFGFDAYLNQVTLDTSVRTGEDYGVVTSVPNITQASSLLSSQLTLWGAPGDSRHDQSRGWQCLATQGARQGECVPQNQSQAPLFLRLPTSCSEPQRSNLLADPWANPGKFAETSAATPPLTGCNQLEFEPTIEARPTTTVADSPAGLRVDLHLPQPESAEGLAEADLKDAKVVLPKGLALNPSAANGLAACSSVQVELHGPNPANCPGAAKIGTVEVDTPLIDHPLQGGVYLAKQGDNPFGSLLAIYIAVNDPQTGVVVKLAGHVEPDPQTGQLTTTFSENPQLPFEDFKLDFFEGANAPLSTPVTCGNFTTTSDLTPWSTPEGADATPSDSFEVGQGANNGPCPASESVQPNKPAFTAGTLTPKAGAYSPFILHLARADGSQRISAVDATLPPGLTGKLAGVAECSDAQLAAAKGREALGQGAAEIARPSCPLASEVGTVSVGAGSGPDPYYVQGHAYLAGPYKGAPLSLAIITPAVAGPFDLGSVVVRTALYVNPETTQIHAVSDPIPTILDGIPLDVRSITLNMNRPQFTLNPTSCDKMVITGTSTSALGQPASLTSPFQVGECAKLGFKPKLSIDLKGATKRAKNPALTATVTYPKGSYANIASAQVALPHSEFLDQAHIKTICTRVQFAEGSTPGEKCPPGSIYGHARATTPLLDQPLEGPVYLRSSSHPLPDLVAALNGQIDVDLDGRIDSVHGGIRNTFEVVPDAPVSKFTLEMQGGKKGLLVNSTDLCKSTNKATVELDAQNGKVDDFNPVVTNSCKKKPKKHNRHGG